MSYSHVLYTCKTKLHTEACLSTSRLFLLTMDYDTENAILDIMPNTSPFVSSVCTFLRASLID